MPTIFSKIIAWEIPCYKIYEDENIFAFLDIHPHTLGHTLIVPKIEIDNFIDVPEPYYSAVFQTAKKLAPALQKATNCKRVGALIIGLDVPHFHYHLIPIQQASDMEGASAHTETPEAMQAIQQTIISYIA